MSYSFNEPPLDAILETYACPICLGKGNKGPPNYELCIACWGEGSWCAQCGGEGCPLCGRPTRKPEIPRDQAFWLSELDEVIKEREEEAWRAQQEEQALLTQQEEQTLLTEAKRWVAEVVKRATSQ